MLALFEPAALIGWLVLGLAALAWRRASGVARSFRATVTVLLVVYFWLATPLGANLMVAALERDVPAAPTCRSKEQGATYVVLAGGQTGVPESEHDIARLHEASFRRTIEGVRLALEDPDGLLVLAGGSGGAVKEADLMRQLALRLGVDPGHIQRERDSATTYESAVGVARRLRSLGRERVLLVTSAMHMPRAAAAFRAQGLRVCPHPVDRRYVRPAIDEALIPQITALVKSTGALHELLGYGWYYATGRL